MKALGNTSIQLFDGVDECPHAPDEHDLWQESWVIYFWDVETQHYVFLRVSQEPNLNGGQHTVWLNAWTPDYQYKNVNTAIPSEQGEVAMDSITVGNGLCQYRYDGQHHWQVLDGKTKIDLVMTDAHPGAAYYGEVSAATENTLKNHIEAIGHAEGSIEINGKMHAVSGPAWRDHSWGKRHWLSLRTHRAYHALFGKDFNFFSLVMVAEDGSTARNGLIMQGDTVQYTQDFKITAYMDEDGVSNKGGIVELNHQGERYKLEFSPVHKSTIQIHHGLPCVDTMCQVTMANKKGVGFAETSNRPLGGEQQPFVLPNSQGVIDNGIFTNK